MKIQKISLIAALALGGLLACNTMTYAQDATQPGAGRRGGGMFGSPQQRVDRLATQLTLTDDQKTKLTALFEEQNKKMQALREEETKKMKEILTPEQFQKYESSMQQMRGRRGGGGGGGQ